MLNSKQVSSDEELKQILLLQRANLKINITQEEIRNEGFVTMVFNMEMLKAMHALAPSIIVKDAEKLAGYAIVFLIEGRHLYPTLEPMFINFEKIVWHERPLNTYNFYVIGQICVAKEYRGGKVFDMLYHKHKEIHKDNFDFVITEISTSNHRSLKAHERVGFKKISTHKDEMDEWDVVLWDWTRRTDEY